MCSLYQDAAYIVVIENPLESVGTVWATIHCKYRSSLRINWSQPLIRQKGKIGNREWGGSDEEKEDRILLLFKNDPYVYVTLFPLMITPHVVLCMYDILNVLRDLKCLTPWYLLIRIKRRKYYGSDVSYPPESCTVHEIELILGLIRREGRLGSVKDPCV